MQSDRAAALLALLEKKPDDARLLFGLAMEYEKQERWADVAATLSRYLAASDDEGNAWGRLGNALRRTGDDDRARNAYERGIAAARSHGHPSMAAEFQDILDEWN